MKAVAISPISYALLIHHRVLSPKPLPIDANRRLSIQQITILLPPSTSATSVPAAPVTAILGSTMGKSEKEDYMRDLQ